jgi:hypothetical protein
MKNLKEYTQHINENFNFRTMILVNKRDQKIEVKLEGYKILEILNNANIRFPYNVGQSWNRSIETWACNNNFIRIETWINDRKANELDPCPEEKIFGIRAKDIPQGHELRLLYPNKFRK